MPNLFILSLLFFSTVVVATSTSWFTAWIGLEMNVMAFIPLIMSSSKTSSEVMIKYFLVQVMGSFILLLSGVLAQQDSPMTFIFFHPLWSMMLTLALTTKLGMFPIYFWFPALAEGLSWSSLGLLMTWQKLAPLSLLIMSPLKPLLMISFGLASAVLGAIAGLNQMMLRKLMAYSSITHLGWITSLIPLSFQGTIFYLLMYILLTTTIIILFSSFNMIHLLQSNMVSTNTPLSLTVIFITTLSLGGMPPFSGFIPKWLTLQMLSLENLYIQALILVWSSVLTLFFYMRINYALLMTNLQIRFPMQQLSIMPWTSLFIITANLALPLMVLCSPL
uniref:NADH-ubiquinone oxidoreductase chain 2 n=1 Tax=Narceus annularis TaxID=174156 RepID=Q8WA92_NARAN|nr:NADH dehydrogenase subunit 2 [Narceus annularus]AAL18215.1 NADH dehydrogenase subunit 2 [Narceus annularus]